MDGSAGRFNFAAGCHLISGVSARFREQSGHGKNAFPRGAAKRTDELQQKRRPPPLPPPRVIPRRRYKLGGR